MLVLLPDAFLDGAWCGLKVNATDGNAFVSQNLRESDCLVHDVLEETRLHALVVGEGVAVPHGTIEAKDAVLKTGIVICQYPAGVRFTEEEDGIAKLVVGIAAKNNEHIQVVSAITNALDSEEAIELLTTTNDVEKVLALLKP